MKTRIKLLGILLSIVLINACGNKEEKTKEDNTTENKDNKEVEKDSPTKVKIDKMATIRAKMMAGVELAEDEKGEYDSLFNSETVKTHYAKFNQNWKQLEDRHLGKMPSWRDSELTEFQNEGRTLFYPFGGPDFLNAYTFFPNCDNYLMFGLEPNGKLVDLDNMPTTYLPSLRKALEDLFLRNYFITSYMSSDLWGKGVLPLINIFLARKGNSIVSMNRFYLDKDGKAQLIDLEDKKSYKGQVTGITIEFINTERSKTQRLYYFSQDVEDKQLAKLPELAKFVRSFDKKITFIKSASYILHNSNFNTVKELVLETDAILQDDTGVRYKDLMDANWNVQLYGKYAKPVADFGGYTYQPALQKAFTEQKDKVKPLSFTYGYHYKTKNTSLLFCTKK